MTYNEALIAHYTDLKSKSDVLELEMSSFITANKKEDPIKLCIDFERTFNTIIWNFHETYSRTCPTSIQDSIFRLHAINNSQKIAIDLRNVYRKIVTDIESTFPPLSDFQGIQK